MWTENFQTYKLNLEKEEELEIKFANLRWIIEKEKNSRKPIRSASLIMLKPLIAWITTHCGKFLDELVIPDHLTCLLRNLYADQDATVRTRRGTMDWFQIEKGVCQGCLLSLCLFNLYAEYIMWNTRLVKHKLKSRLPGEKSITLDMEMTLP